MKESAVSVAYVEGENAKKDMSPMVWAAAGTAGIGLVLYAVQVLGMQDFVRPFGFIQANWYFFLPLVAGFGIQMGLFRAIHQKVRHLSGVLAASGGVSASAMFACCMHNLVTLFPIVGLTGMAVFFSTYQNYVFMASILFTVGGIVYMWNKYRRLSHSS